MLYYLDTNIVIYAVEGQPPFQQRARNHIAALDNAGHRFVVSELTCTECLVQPLRTGDAALLLDYEQFFVGPHLTTVALPPPRPSSGGGDSRRLPLQPGGRLASGGRG